MRSLGISFVLGLTATVLPSIVPAANAQQIQPAVSQPFSLMTFQRFSPTVVLSPETGYPRAPAYQPGSAMPYNSPNPYAMPYAGYQPYQMSNQRSDYSQQSYGDYGSYPSQTAHMTGNLYASASAESGQAQRIVDITIRDNYFQPARIEIPVGTRVQWTNAGQHIHSVTSDENPWELSVQLAPRDTYSRTFRSPGVYPYHCMMHSVAMRGIVVVK